MLMTINGSHTGTHTAPLAISCMHTTGSVLELGCGLYSTLLLHTICGKQGRRLHTVDHTLSWLKKFMHLETPLHTFEHLKCGSLNVTIYEFMYRLSPKWTKRIDESWDQVGKGERWGLVFLDQLPLSRRIKDVKRLRQSADVFVIHNTNMLGNWLSEFWPYLNTFKFTYIFPVFPATAVCSDTMDVRSFF
jgi:hypothetical protein